MKHPISLGLASIMLIGPSSQAVLSNAGSYDMNQLGYHCTRLQGYQRIIIDLDEHPTYTQSCSVTLQRPAHQNRVLWQHQRSYWNCEQKAQHLAQRLTDRGWQCQGTGI